MRASFRVRYQVLAAAAAAIFCARLAGQQTLMIEYASSNCMSMNSANCNNCLNGILEDDGCSAGYTCCVWGGQGTGGAGLWNSCVSVSGSGNNCVDATGSDLTACPEGPYWDCDWCPGVNNGSPPAVRYDCTGKTCFCQPDGADKTGNVIYTPNSGTCTQP
jgi:hypothetical protein